MPENYICKDCNYASDKAGLCPYCDMPLEPLDPTKIDPDTGTPSESYDKDELKKVQEDADDLPPLPKEDEGEDDELEVEPEEDLVEEEPLE